MIDAGAAGVHFEDQLSSAKKCGHMGGKVLVPTQEAVNKLVAARLAAVALASAGVDALADQRPGPGRHKLHGITPLGAGSAPPAGPRC